jgi:bifunctional enzyme CysN/CysC
MPNDTVSPSNEMRVGTTAGDLMRVVIVGHVDHGKSTLVGRMFHDTGQLPDGKLEAIQEMCRRRGMPFEWAFLMDSLKAERDQGVTIDTSQIWFRHNARQYVIIDAPGHREFIRNMVTGASNADAALLMIDADQGVRRQSRHHSYLLQLLGVQEVAVAVNKMDLVDYDEARFREIEAEYTSYLAGIGVTARRVIPISAREGDNVASTSDRMGWYDGPSVIETLAEFELPASSQDLPLRLPLQDVYKFDDRRILAGRIESGSLKTGDELLFPPATGPRGSHPSKAGTPTRSPGQLARDNRSGSRWMSRSSWSAARWRAISHMRPSKPMCFTFACSGWPTPRSKSAGATA